MAPKSMLALLLSSLQDVLRVLAVAVAAFAMMAVVTVAFAPVG